MEDILKYENRDQLYKFLINDFGLVKVDERYDPDAFGNFYVTLSAKDFLLSYVNDRSFLTINISSKLEPENDLDLSFVRDFIYNPNNINDKEEWMDNVKRIEKLNDFLKEEFSRISLLFSPNNYHNTKKQIDELLKQQFKRRNPGLIE